MEIPKSFLGYKRENGRAGTRNHVIILPVDDISNACAEAVANNIKGTIALPHSYGRLQFGADLELHFRTMIGTGKNPNVAAVIVIGIEPKWTKRIVDEIAKTRYDIEMIRELGYCQGIENYSRYLSGRAPGEPPPTLFEYLPDNALLVVDESHVTVPQIGAMYKGDRSRKETLVEYGFRLPSALDNRPMKFEEWELMSPQAIFVSATPGAYEKEHAGATVEQVVRPTGLVDPVVEVRPARTQVDDLLAEIRETTAKGDRVLVTTLTKRMSEDLTEYLSEHDVRVRYLHSDIDTVERVEIIRDLRLGHFDVLVGINLLREGLDMPEVSLVAILDADKEGFLRSDRSLIQTIGRAARHLNGRAILYADAMTGSMERAMNETQRRRDKQLAFNEANGVVPKGIEKSVRDILEGARRMPTKARSARDVKVANDRISFAKDVMSMTPATLSRKLAELENAMAEHAKNLEFEEAAAVRDQIAELKQIAFVGA